MWPVLRMDLEIFALIGQFRMAILLTGPQMAGRFGRRYLYFLIFTTTMEGNRIRKFLEKNFKIFLAKRISESFSKFLDLSKKDHWAIFKLIYQIRENHWSV